MKKDKTYDLLLRKMRAVSDLPQQTMGPLTPLYRMVIPYFKESPWRFFAAGSFMFGLILYIVFGALIVKLVSVLQHGF
jgi:hypothetical protein